MVMVQRHKSINTSGTFSVGYGFDDSVNKAQPAKDAFSFDGDIELRSPRPGTSSSKSKGRLTALAFTVIQYLVLGGTCFYAYRTNSQLDVRTKELVEVQGNFETLRIALSETELDLAHAKDNFFKLHTQMNTMMGKTNTEIDESKEGRDELSHTIIKRTDAQNDRIGDLQREIQRMNREEIETRWGEGPYLIEFAIILEGSRTFFTVETAPTLLMPHSILFFLDCVESGVWDDTVLLHRVEHVVQAAPFSISGDTKIDTLHKKSLVFPEYSNDYPHKEFTLGFSGRPGGPEFYINTIDNDENHGPGGQEHHALVEEADPCFATVVVGHNVVSHLTELNRHAMNEDNPLYTKIETVRIIKRASDENL